MFLIVVGKTECEVGDQVTNLTEHGERKYASYGLKPQLGHHALRARSKQVKDKKGGVEEREKEDATKLRSRQLPRFVTSESQEVQGYLTDKKTHPLRTLV